MALIAIGVLDNFDLRSPPVDGADSVHLQIEAVKLAFADGWRYVGDIDHMDVAPAGTARQGIPEVEVEADRSRSARQDFGHGNPPKVRHGVPHGGRCFRHVRVSFIQSNFMGFGSGVVVEGISHKNRGGK